MLGAPSFARTTIPLTEKERVVVLHDAGNKSAKIWMPWSIHFHKQRFGFRARRKKESIQSNINSPSNKAEGLTDQGNRETVVGFWLITSGGVALRWWKKGANEGDDEGWRGS
jgi:hypothetical protein